MPSALLTMATVVFVGDGRDDPPEVTVFGLCFPLGEPVAVDDRAHIEALFKLRRHSHFVVYDQSVEYVRMTMMGPPDDEQPPNTHNTT